PRCGFVQLAALARARGLVALATEHAGVLLVDTREPRAAPSCAERDALTLEHVEALEAEAERDRALVAQHVRLDVLARVLEELQQEHAATLASYYAPDETLHVRLRSVCAVPRRRAFLAVLEFSAEAHGGGTRGWGADGDDEMEGVACVPTASS